jgi:hypothetical protein
MKTIWTLFLKNLVKKANVINLPGVGKVKGLTQPNWKDSKSNLLWAIWLVISSINYFKTGILSYISKWPWFKNIFKVFIIIWKPISKVFKILRIFRIIRFGLIIGSLFISIIYSPKDAWTILLNIISVTIMNIDLFFDIIKSYISDYFNVIAKKVEDIKPSIEPLKDPKNYPRLEKVEKDKPNRKRLTYSDEKPVLIMDRPKMKWDFSIPKREPEPESIFSNKYFWIGVIVVNVIVIGGMVYYFYYSGSKPDNLPKPTVNNNNNNNSNPTLPESDSESDMSKYFKLPEDKGKAKEISHSHTRSIEAFENYASTSDSNVGNEWSETKHKSAFSIDSALTDNTEEFIEELSHRYRNEPSSSSIMTSETATPRPSSPVESVTPRAPNITVIPASPVDDKGGNPFSNAINRFLNRKNSPVDESDPISDSSVYPQESNSIELSNNEVLDNTPSTKDLIDETVTPRSQSPSIYPQESDSIELSNNEVLDNMENYDLYYKNRYDSEHSSYSKILFDKHEAVMSKIRTKFGIPDEDFTDITEFNETFKEMLAHIDVNLDSDTEGAKILHKDVSRYLELATRTSKFDDKDVYIYQNILNSYKHYFKPLPHERAVNSYYTDLTYPNTELFQKLDVANVYNFNLNLSENEAALNIILKTQKLFNNSLTEALTFETSAEFNNFFKYMILKQQQLIESSDDKKLLWENCFSLYKYLEASIQIYDFDSNDKANYQKVIDMLWAQYDDKFK